MSSNQESKEIISLLQKNWSNLEAVIQSVNEVTGFSEFCLAYRGSMVQGHAGVSVLIREQKVHQVVAFFNNFLSQVFINEDTGNSLLLTLEKAINTALYYSYFDGDRNFQFRTFIHFLQIDSFEFSVQARDLPVKILVNEFGFSLSLDGRFSKFPERFSIAKVLGLSQFWPDGEPSSLQTESALQKVRALQQEFCLLIDEWEHLNSILAVEQFELRKLQGSDPDEVLEKMKSIAKKRDGLALWCIESTADFQVFLSQLKSAKSLSSDLCSEINALDALILAGVQKYLLPASVSRHVYSQPVLVELLRWARARMAHEPDDLYLQFAEATVSIAIGAPVLNLKITEFLSKRSSDWVLSAEPSAAIKAVAWALSPAEHLFFTAALVVALECKTAPQPIDSYWLHTIASVIEMPGTFPCDQKTQSISKSLEEATQSLIGRALDAVDNATCNGDEELQRTKIYIKEFLSSKSAALHLGGPEN